MHPECLERWINTRTAQRAEERHTCEVCRAPYNIKVVSKLGTDQLCSGASWSQYITCVMLLLMFAMLGFVIWVYVNSEEYKSEENADTEWLLWLLTAATGLLFLSTMAKIYERWRDANLTERVEINEREADGHTAQATPVGAAAAAATAGMAAPVALLAAPAENLAVQGQVQVRGPRGIAMVSSRSSRAEESVPVLLHAAPVPTTAVGDVV